MLRPKKQNDTVLPAGAAPTPVVFPGLQHMILLAVLSLLAGIEPFLCRQPSLPEPSLSVKWPEKINGIKMRPVANVPNDSLFEERFPGQAKQFTDGINSYLIRWVRSATRQLHPGSDCFRGMGYTIEFGPLVDMPGGTRWSSFTAVKGGARLKVLERICDEKGRSWTDVSAWYWSACSGTTKGPWWDIVIARKL